MRWSVLLDGFRAVGEVVAQTLISGVVAITVALLCANGFFWTGRSPAQQGRVEFITTDMVYLTVFFGVSMAVGYSAPLARYQWIKSPTRAPSHLFWFARLVQVSWRYFALAAVWIVGVSVATGELSERWRPLTLHFYLGAIGIQFYLSVLDVKSRTLYRTETAKGLTQTARSIPTWKRIVKAYVDNIGYLVTVYVASVYIHLSSRLTLENQETFVVFSVASMALRMALMKVLLWLVTRKQAIHVRTLYVLTTVPTVMIGTQVRVALLRVTCSVSTTSVVVLAAIEPLMRIFKVWRVRREVGTHVTTVVPSSEAVVPSDIQPVRVMPDPPRRLSRQDSQRVSSRIVRGMATQLVLQFTEAETHADMCSEYIAIASSLALFGCLEGNPKFSWSVHGSANAQPVWSSTTAALVGLQLAVELVVDTVCCLWEIANGIPLRTSNELQRFLLGLFAGCTVTNICVCYAIYIR